MTDTTSTPRPTLDAALTAIAAGARERDRDAGGAFPEAAIAALERAGALCATAGDEPLDYAGELALLRTVAAGDAGVARILDGHLNAVERLRVPAPPRRCATPSWPRSPPAGCGPASGAPTRPRTRASRRALTDGAVCAGQDVLLGRGRPGPRARARRRGDGAGPPLAAWVDLTRAATRRGRPRLVPRRGHALVGQPPRRFDGAPVARASSARPGALLAQPWFARDAVRTAATWAGAADAAVEDALAQLAARPARRARGAGRRAADRPGSAAIGLWLADAARACSTPSPATPRPRDRRAAARRDRRRRPRDPRRGRARAAARAPPRPARRSTAPRATCASSCSSTAWSRSSPAPARAALEARAVRPAHDARLRGALPRRPPTRGAR